MTYRSDWCRGVRSAFFISLITVCTLVAAKQASHHDVRVLLGKMQTGVWKLKASGGFILIPPGKSTQLEVKNDELTLTVRDGLVSINGKRLRHDEVSIRPRQGFLSFNDKSFGGSFSIDKDGKVVLLINTIDLEEYVASVVRTESWPGWPLEVNKVFAIACRSYALAMQKRAQKNKRPYDLKNTNAHQTYAGVHSCQGVKRAVEMTRGVYLAYDGNPITAMFDSCCGGVSPAKIADFDFARAPYLARKKTCSYCKRCKIYSWQAQWPLAEFEKKLRTHLLSIGKLSDVRVSKKDKAGLVQQVTCKGRSGAKTLTGAQLYAALPAVKSFCFDVATKAGTVTLKGRGFGHHIGLCQWGAREMVRDDWAYKRILRFYYPGTQLKQLT